MGNALCQCLVSKATFTDDAILAMDAYTLSEHISNKQISCQQVMKVTLDHIDAINKKYNAIILLKEKGDLLFRARQADYTIDNDYYYKGGGGGWLHGIPIAIKDLSNVAGLPTTMGGSTMFENFKPNVNDLFVEHLIQQGAIVIGKTNTPENGLGSHTFNTKFGTTVNPYNETKSAGGSSGGAAVAIATRMLCIADGSDMMGSLRNPAGWNCIYSFRPTAGIVKGTLPCKKNPLSYPISTVGPMARTPRDLTLLLDTLVNDKSVFNAANVLKHNPLIDNNNNNNDDDGENNRRSDEKNNNNINHEIIMMKKKIIRIGWLGDWNGSYPFENGILDTCHDALINIFEDNGHVVLDLSKEEIFDSNKLWTSWNAIRFALVSFNYIQSFGKDKVLGPKSPLKQELQWEIQQGSTVTNQQLQDAGQVALEYSIQLNEFMQKHELDALALPSAQVWPFPKEWTYPKSINDIPMDTYHRWMEVAVPVSLGGLPACTIPAGLFLFDSFDTFDKKEENGKNNNYNYNTIDENNNNESLPLPMGIQLFAPRNSDVLLLQIANYYHSQIDWPSKCPPPFLSSEKMVK